jgi:hypothetical protein
VSLPVKKSKTFAFLSVPFSRPDQLSFCAQVLRPGFGIDTSGGKDSFLTKLLVSFSCILLIFYPFGY